MDRYWNETYNQLKDENIYELVAGNTLKDVYSLINRRLKSLEKEGKISKDNRMYLRGKQCKLCRFYLLPKIHKRLQNVPGKSVISNCGSATKQISEFVDFHLQHVIFSLPCVIKDTTDFLNRLQELGNISEGTILCSMDVVG